MKEVFVDTCFWIALLNAQDDLAPKIKAIQDSLRTMRLVTTEAVLVELLNAFCGHTSLRSAAAHFVEEVSKNTVEVVPQSSVQFREGVELYSERPDKEWSHTDCVAFQIMQDRNMDEALTNDHHFEQAGFKALLREP